MRFWDWYHGRPLYEDPAWKWAAIRARVRDDHRCTFVDVRGDRCSSKARIVHHIRPMISGGAALDLANLTTVCRLHHGVMEQQARARTLLVGLYDLPERTVSRIVLAAGGAQEVSDFIAGLVVDAVDEAWGEKQHLRLAPLTELPSELSG